MSTHWLTSLFQIKPFMMRYRPLSRCLGSCWIKMADTHLHLAHPLTTPTDTSVGLYPDILTDKPWQAYQRDPADISLLVKGHISNTISQCNRLVPMFYVLHIYSGTYPIFMVYIIHIYQIYWPYSLPYTSHYCHVLFMSYILYIIILTNRHASPRILLAQDTYIPRRHKGCTMYMTSLTVVKITLELSFCHYAFFTLEKRCFLHIPVENEHQFRFKMNAYSGLRVHRFRTTQNPCSSVE